MLEKTFKTWGKHPIILVLFVLTGAANFIIGQFGFTIMYEYTNRNIMALTGYNFVTNLLSAIFIYGPIIYFLSLAAADKAHKNWYIKGMKRGWWRYWLVVLIYGFLSFLGDAIMSNIYSSGNAGPFEIMQAYHLKAWLVKAVLGVIFYLMAIPLIAEEKFGVGFVNIFKVGKKYFLKFFVIHFILSAVYWFSYVEYFPRELGLFGVVLCVIYLFAVIVIEMFLNTYCMTLYINNRETEGIETEFNEEITDA